MLSRRHFVVSTAALAATAAPALAGLDPTNADIKFGTTGSIFGAWDGPSGAMKMSTNMKMMLEDVKHYGLEGFEPYSGQVVQYLGKPLELKKLADEVGVQIACVGDLPRRPGAEARRAAGSAPVNGASDETRVISGAGAVTGIAVAAAMPGAVS